MATVQSSTPAEDKTSCVACNRPDSADNFVQCDACDSWWHFSCAGVTDSVSEKTWTCTKCAVPRSISSRTSRSSRSSTNIATNMRLLKKRQELEKKLNELALQKKFLDEQQQLLDSSLAEEEKRSQASRRASLQRVQQWMKENADQEEGAMESHLQPSAASRVQLQPSELLQEENDAVIRLHHCQQPSKPTLEQYNELRQQVELYKSQLEKMQASTTIHLTEAPQSWESHQSVIRQSATQKSVRCMGAIPKAHPNKQQQEGKCQAFGVEINKSTNKNENYLHYENPLTTNHIFEIPNREQLRNVNARLNEVPNSQQCTRSAIDDATAEPFRQSDMHNNPNHYNMNIMPNRNSITHEQSVPDQHQQQSYASDQQPARNNRHFRSNHHVDFSAGPTQRQLMARQSFARELPIFNGDPSEWPIFISNYEYTSEACGYTNGENMLRLQRCLRGHALETVRGRLVLPAAVPHVIETLRMRYGRPEILINALLQKARAIPSPKSDKLDGLIEYGMAVLELRDHIEAAQEHSHLANPTLLQELVGKLPANQKLMWAGYRRSLPTVDLRNFGDYMSKVVQDAMSVTLYEAEGKKINEKERPKQKGFLNAHADEENKSSVTVSKVGLNYECLNCGKFGHILRECEKFKALSVDERWRKIRAKSLCQNCLFGHGRRSCRSNNRCNVDGCMYRHHPLLHSNKRQNAALGVQVGENHTHLSGAKTLFRIIPVTLYGNQRTVNTFAFLDEGSSLTLIEEELAVQLGIVGTMEPLCLRWTGNTIREEKRSQKVTILISGEGQNRRHQLTNARTVECLKLPTQSFNYDKAAGEYHHLKHLPLQGYHNAVPKLLIGLDNLRLAVPVKIKEGDGNGPVAVKTRLGWCVYGPHQQKFSDGYSFHLCQCTADEELNEAVKQFYAVEEASLKPLDIITNDERRARRLLEETTRRVENRFETGLLWKQDEITLPDSYAMALRRLECLERRMDRDPPLKANLHRQIQEYQEKGYAHKATSMELRKAEHNRIWYLPLGAVMNPHKPGKVRVIWDAAAKINNISLNSVLLKGPDQLTLLPAILFRFRQYQVAVSSDIQEMFHQIRVREEDKHSQRFLWRSSPSQPPEVYLMDVMTFGSTCSPASAQYVKNVNATEQANEYPRAAEAIIKSHYVDDYLDSFGSEEEAGIVAAQVRSIHQNGGFILRNWRSNSERVLTQLGETTVDTAKSLSLVTPESTNRVLGMLWDPVTDELSFSTKMSEEVKSLMESGTTPTKRQVLRCVMTLFDPLGLLTPFLIHGKVLIQHLWRSGIGWDEYISESLFKHWRMWLQMIHSISTIKIPRAYFPQASESTYKEAQLHVFVDASEIAYSCAVYIRATDQQGRVKCALIAGKAKVAPLKPTSIPRLELQGCVLGTRMLKFVQEHHTVPISKRTLWTDSSTAKSWIKADPRNYRPYVAHRVGEILEATNVDEWRWIPSKFNPADEATKWGKGPYFSRQSKWFTGPDFLLLPEEHWPHSPTINSTTEEIRQSVLFHTTRESVIAFGRFSSWTKLLRTVAYVLRFLNNTRGKGSIFSGQLQKEELQAANITLVKMIQLESYLEEITILKHNQTLSVENRKSIEKSSTIYQLLPFIDDNGMLRQRGRLPSTHVPFEVCYPMILPKEHPATLLLIDSYHRLYRHANAETVVNEMRQLYSISKLRTLVKKVSRNCQLCKIRKACPSVPPMSRLPPARLAVNERAFSHVGLDYFGPLFVKVGRSNVKRWIALFTCLTVRAIHLEVAFSLSTASCISCVRRFVSRRGSPTEFFSDNGTNFQGAERILRQQINEGLSATFTNAKTKWKFIPPSAPHMGGAWERLVQSVKVAIRDAYEVGKLDDEGLQTLVVEAENLVNSRPLTFLPLYSAESEALTPNHFLLGSSSGAKFNVVDINVATKNVRNSWEQIQYQLNMFWQRWLKEYLPDIRRQTKWFDEIKAIRVGDLVLVADFTKRNGWIRGRVNQVIPGPDGRIRQAIVQTSCGTLRRPVAKLAVLDVGGSSAIPEPTGMHPGEDVDTTCSC